MSKGKNPAFLFYPADFLTGTMFLSLGATGAYIKILCAQFEKGHLTQAQIGAICPPELWDEIAGNFSQDEAGLYYNERLEYEQDRRRKYSESRANNRRKDKKDMKNISNTHVIDMVNENVNVNSNSKKGTREAKQEVALPWDSPEFLAAWDIWKAYRIEIKKPIKGPISEQAALKKLATLSAGDETNAILIIHQSIANNWQGLFELKNDGKQATSTRDGHALINKLYQERANN